MIITEIKPRRKGLSSLYIDDEFVANLDSQTLLENRFDVGKEIDDEQLHEVIKQSQEKRAKGKALWLIAYRDHSKKELADKIKRSFDENSAEKAVERMEELGLVDDEGYARRYAQKVMFAKHMSKKGAVYELVRKGIDKELAEEIVDEIEVDPQEQIMLIIEKKYKNINDEKIRRRAVSALQRLGYGWEDIKSAINEYNEVNDNEL